MEVLLSLINVKVLLTLINVKMLLSRIYVLMMMMCNVLHSALINVLRNVALCRGNPLNSVPMLPGQVS